MNFKGLAKILHNGVQLYIDTYVFRDYSRKSYEIDLYHKILSK